MTTFFPCGCVSRSQRVAMTLDAFVRRPGFAVAAAAAIAGLAFVLVTERALPLLGGLVTTLVIGTVSPWVIIAGARPRVGFDRRRCRVGESLVASVAWQEGGVPWWQPRLTLDWPGTRETSAPCPQRRESVVRMPVVPRRHGRFPRDAPALATAQPFGLVTARRCIPITDHVVVWPAKAMIRFPAGLVAAAGMGRDPSDRVSGTGGDVTGAREYRPGDSARSIHWAHTARREAIIVRERPGTAAAAVRLFVDHRAAPPTTRGADDGCFDAIVAIAFAIVETWAARGVSFELMWPDAEPLIPRTPPALEAALDAIACLEPIPLAVLLRRGQGRPRRSAVDVEVLLTTATGQRGFAEAGALDAVASHHTRRIWIIVAGHRPSPADQGATGRWSRITRDSRGIVVEVAADAEPIAAIDNLFATLMRDPDSRIG